jgi:hypothetical protein
VLSSSNKKEMNSDGRSLKKSSENREILTREGHRGPPKKLKNYELKM